MKAAAAEPCRERERERKREREVERERGRERERERGRERGRERERETKRAPDPSSHPTARLPPHRIPVKAVLVVDHDLSGQARDAYDSDPTPAAKRNHDTTRQPRVQYQYDCALLATS